MDFMADLFLDWGVEHMCKTVGNVLPSGQNFQTLSRIKFNISILCNKLIKL